MHKNDWAAPRTGRILFFILITLIILIVPVWANSIQFSGLEKVNKTIEIQDINQVASGGNGYVSTINNSELFYFTPGDSYVFIVKPQNNTTILNNATTLSTFIFSTQGEALLILVASIFLLFMFCGGAVILWMVFWRRRKQ